MDDEVLGCGGTMLLHTDKRQVHCIYVSDGEKSPRPLLPWQGRPDEDLGRQREREARQALKQMGIPVANSTFMHLPDGTLHKRQRQLKHLLKQEIVRINPDFICVPFHYDLHPDHVAVQRAVRALQRTADIQAKVLEYFIYFRWPLIREGDIRCRAPKDLLLEVDVSSVRALKHAALACYPSQTNVIYSWQEKPVLTEASLAQRCQEPEYLLLSDPSKPIGSGFSGNSLWLRLAHLSQMHGKRPKDQFIALCKWSAALIAPQRGQANR
jgi:LmbE family N-acetylglucosaminyl deacetylase